MSTTNFTPGTVVTSAWLNDVNDLRYDNDGATHVLMTPSGTGAQVRTVQDKERDKVSLFDFMSPTDRDSFRTSAGTVDVTAALQAAHDSLGAGGGIIEIPAGGGRISSTITISKAGVTIAGSSRENTNGSRLLKTSAVSGDMFRITGPHASIRDIVLTGQVGNAGNGITVLEGYFKADGVQIVTMGQDGLRIGNSTGTENCNHFTLTMVDTISCVRHGFYLDSQTTDAGGGTFIGCSSYNDGGDGFKFDRSQLNTLVGCVSESNAGAGFNLAAGARDIWIVGGDSEANGTNYIKDPAALRCNVIASWVDDTIGARVSNSAAQSIPNAAATELTFDTEDWDTDAIHSTSVNTGRLTATTKGKYLVTVNVLFAANATGYRKVLLRKSGGAYFATDTRGAFAVDDCAVSMTAPIFLDVGQYVTCEVVQTSGGALNVLAGATFSMTRMH